MKILELVRKAFIDGYASMDLKLSDIIACMLCTVILAVYVYIVYKEINKKSFYNKNFNMSLIALAVITAAIILTIQSNIIVSLGMVGALSIVRFRTAVKDPLDLVFLFWSISIGIICGAGFALIAVVASGVVTVVIVFLSNAKEVNGTMLLVVNANECQVEQEIMEVVKGLAVYVKVKARNASQSGMNMALEVKGVQEQELIKQLLKIEAVTTASLVDYEGDVTV